MNSPKKLIGAAALVTALAAGGAAGALIGVPGTSGAQESTAPPAGHGHGRHGERLEAKLAVAATALGMSEADLRTALESGKTIARVAKDHGVDVNAVIDALVADAQTDLRARITAIVNGERPVGRPGGRGDHHGRGHRDLRPDPQVVADALGMSTADVRAALESGQTLAHLATAHGVDVQDLIDAMVTSAFGKIDAKVASGDLDSARADKIKAKLVERITAFVNGERPADDHP